jgi:GAF domain-containing protein
MARNTAARTRAPQAARSAEPEQGGGDLARRLAAAEARARDLEARLAAAEHDADEIHRQWAEAREQQAATAEILRVISNGPTDLQRVLDVVADSAVYLCEGDDAQVSRVEGNVLRTVARRGDVAPGSSPVGGTLPLSPGFVTGRAVLERRTIHIPDFAAVPQDELPATPARAAGIRAGLATPLLREGVPIGVIAVRRRQARPFTEQQITLLETFADQAVIAIENTGGNRHREHPPVPGAAGA